MKKLWLFLIVGMFLIGIVSAATLVDLNEEGEIVVMTPPVIVGYQDEFGEIHSGEPPEGFFDDEGVSTSDEISLKQIIISMIIGFVIVILILIIIIFFLRKNKKRGKK